MAKTFTEWLAAVDRAVAARCGLSTADLVDCCYADWFADGVTPTQAARLVLAEEGF